MEFILEAVSIYYVVTISNSSLTLSGNANADMSIFPQHRALVSVGGGSTLSQPLHHSPRMSALFSDTVPALSSLVTLCT